nr:MAG TPA: hypothetical protein [Herelleviridae sp.]
MSIYANYAYATYLYSPYPSVKMNTHTTLPYTIHTPIYIYSNNIDIILLFEPAFPQFLRSILHTIH